MRLWHKDLIPYLPKNQLISQWRELCCIAKNISVNGTPNHILVNKIMDYSIDHFYLYSTLVTVEMKDRGYKIKNKSLSEFTSNLFDYASTFFPKPDGKQVTIETLYSDWHNDRYFIQCYFNLQEKHDCKGIKDNEWEYLQKFVASKGSINF